MPFCHLQIHTSTISLNTLGKKKQQTQQCARIASAPLLDLDLKRKEKGNFFSSLSQEIQAATLSILTISSFITDSRPWAAVMSDGTPAFIHFMNYLSHESQSLQLLPEIVFLEIHLS